MSDRTNLNASSSPIKYILGSILFLTLSGIGLFWLVQRKQESEYKKAVIISATPTETTLVTPTVVAAKITTTSAETTKKTATVTTTLITTPTATIVATATPKTIESYVNNDDGFSVAYNSARKLYIENEDSGKRYIFYSYSGNITVHAGKTWSWINSGRIFTDKLLIDGEKSYVYEISNQKIVDIEKNNKKYTIQCVHNAKKELITECEEFLNNFKFI